MFPSLQLASPTTSRGSSCRFLLSVAMLVTLAAATSSYAQGVLENPAPDSRQSGIGTVSGWRCTAGELSLSFDGGPLTKVAYGTGREDTRLVCGDADNGFSYLINWNLLGDGEHTLRLYDNGVQFAESTFEVVTLGTNFLRGITGSRHMADFPTPGEGTTLQWQQGAQGFVITDWVPKGSALVRYQGNIFCNGSGFTSTVGTSGNTWISVNGAVTDYQRVSSGGLYPDALSYSDDATDCLDPVPQPSVLELVSGRRYTMSWIRSSAYRGFELELINDDEDSGPTNIPCFVAGTLVMTPDGEVPIESLEAGDLVVRPDGDWAIVTEVRATPVGGAVPMIGLAAGSVAPGVPSRPTVMTQDHRIGINPDRLYKGWEFCGVPDVVCEPREVDFVYNLRLDGWKSTFLANGLVADTLQDRDWRLSVD